MFPDWRRKYGYDGNFTENSAHAYKLRNLLTEWYGNRKKKLIFYVYSEREKKEKKT